MSSIGHAVDLEKCIICQEDKVDLRPQLSSTANGQKAVKRAAETREDEVTKRLCLIGDIKFSYHMNNDCYKWYTHSGKVEFLRKKKTPHQMNILSLLFLLQKHLRNPLHLGRHGANVALERRQVLILIPTHTIFHVDIVGVSQTKGYLRKIKS